LILTEEERVGIMEWWGPTQDEMLGFLFPLFLAWIDLMDIFLDE
jgi:hypothetical protein